MSQNENIETVNSENTGLDINLSSGTDMIMPMSSQKVVIDCKGCGNTILVDKTATVAVCDFCQRSHNVVESVSSNNTYANIAGISTSSAALAYIEHLFERYDWVEFSKDTFAFSIKEIDALLEKIKTAYGDEAKTWQICFYYLHTCISQKIKCLKYQLDIVIDNFVKKGNYSKCYNDYEDIKSSADAIQRRRDLIIKDLDIFIRDAAKYGLSQNDLNYLNQERNSLLESINSLNLPEELRAYSVIETEIAKENAAKAIFYKSKGIDAEAVYKTALNYFNGKQYSLAMEEFVKIYTYKDSVDYIEKINKPLIIDDFIIINEEEFFKKTVVNEEYSGHLEIVPTADKLLSDAPLISGDFKIVDVYGSEMYYWQQSLPNILRKTDIISNKLYKNGDLKCHFHTEQYPFYGGLIFPEKYMVNKNNFVFLVKHDCAVKEKKKFFGRYGVTQKIQTRIGGVYDVWIFDEKRRKASLLVQGISEFSERKGEIIYYIAPVAVAKNSKNVAGYSLYSQNIMTGEKNLLLSGAASIRKVLNDKSVIFTRNVLGDNNMSIYRKPNLEAENETLLAENVYRYYDTIGDSVFYLMGNMNIKSLCSVHVDGGENCEVMRYLKEIIFHDEDYVYSRKGDEKDAFSICRVPVTGGEEEFVAYGVKNLVVVDGNELKSNKYTFKGKLFYTNYYNVLCSVRLNGTGYCELVPNVERVVSVGKEKIYYLARDYESDGKYVLSFYCMNFDGTMRSKVVYNILNAISSFDNRIIYTAQRVTDDITKYFRNITDKKLKKKTVKTYKSLKKLGISLKVPYTSLSIYNCRNGETGELSTNIEYPTQKSLKLLLKESKLKIKALKKG